MHNCSRAILTFTRTDAHIRARIHTQQPRVHHFRNRQNICDLLKKNTFSVVVLPALNIREVKAIKKIFGISICLFPICINIKR